MILRKETITARRKRDFSVSNMKKIILSVLLSGCMFIRFMAQQTIANGNILNYNSLFDIKKFNKHKGNEKAFSYVENDSLIIQREKTIGYEVIKKLKSNENFYRKYIYNDKGRLIEKSAFFSNLPIEKRMLYDQDGRIIFIEDFEHLHGDMSYPSIKEQLKQLNFNFEKWQSIQLFPIAFYLSGVILQEKYWVLVNNNKIDDVGATQKSIWLIEGNYEGKIRINSLDTRTKD